MKIVLDLKTATPKQMEKARDRIVNALAEKAGGLDTAVDPR